MPPPSGAFDLQSHHPLDIFDLRRLPIELHEVLKVILLLPLGALVTAIVRTIVGLRTFGTFTPTLLALSFVYNDWLTGRGGVHRRVDLGFDQPQPWIA